MILVSFNKYIYLRWKMRQMHITSTSSPNRTAAPTTPATTAPMRTPVLSGVGVVLSMLSVVSLVSIVASGVTVASGLVVE